MNTRSADGGRRVLGVGGDLQVSPHPKGQKRRPCENKSRTPLTGLFWVTSNGMNGLVYKCPHFKIEGGALLLPLNSLRGLWSAITMVRSSVVKWPRSTSDIKKSRGADTSYSLDFLHSGKHVIDALHGSGLGRLINHGRKHPNLKAVGRILGGNLYLLFETVRKILPGDELLYNYGQRSYTTKEGERIRPEWLNSCPCRICQEEERRKRKKKKKE